MGQISNLGTLPVKADSDKVSPTTSVVIVEKYVPVKE